MEFKDIFITSILIGIGIFALIGFLFGFTYNNNGEVNILDDPIYSQLNSSLSIELSGSSGTAQAQKEALDVDNPIIGTDSFLFTTIINSGKIFSNGITAIWNLTLGALINKLGVNTVIISGFVSIILVVIVLALWSLWKTGR